MVLLSIFNTIQIIFVFRIITSSVGQEVPFLDITDEEIDIQHGIDFSINCNGEKPLKWTYPTRKVSPSTQNVYITSDNSTGVYVSKITINEISYEDTGYFTCKYADDTTEAKVFVFVNDPVSEHLIKPFSRSPIFSVSLVQNQPAVIPCVPTNSHANMTLILGSDQRVIKVGGDVLYDKKIGFTLLFPTVEYSGHVNCKAILGDNTMEKMIILYYRTSSKPPLPDVTSESQNYKLLSNITLKCKIIMSRADGILMTWACKNCNDPSDDRIRIIEPKRTSQQSENGYVYDELVGYLEILNARKDDSGVYKCKVENEAQSNSRDFVINVHELVTVQLTVDDPIIEINASFPHVKLVLIVYYDSYILPNYKWYKNEIEIQNDNTYETQHDSKKFLLYIHNPQKSNQGMYKLVAETKDDTDEATIEVLYSEKPNIQLNLPVTKPYYAEKRNYTITARTGTVYPTPSLTWQWQPCRQSFCRQVNNLWLPITSSANGFILDITRKRLKFTAVEAGWIRCIAENKMGDEEDSVRLFVTDLVAPTPVGLHFNDTALQVVETEPINMECSANKWKYGLPQVFLTGSYDTLLTNSSTVSVIYTSSNYSNFVQVHINQSELQNSGLYRCKVQKQIGYDGKSKNVHVEAIVPPKFSSEVYEGNLSINPDDVVSLHCAAQGVPKPVITWYKNDVVVQSGNAIKFSVGKTNLTIVRVKEADEGMYICKASNLGGTISRNFSVVVAGDPFTENTKQEGLTAANIGIIAGVCAPVVIIGIVLAIVCTKYMRMKQRKNHPASALLLPSKAQINPDIPMDEQTDTLAYDQEWEFPIERLKQGMILGQGAFGKVVKAQAIGIEEGVASSTVAVKTVRDADDMEQIRSLISELKILIHIGQHLNIMNLLGAVTKNIDKGEFYVIVEYCPHGNLRSYLIKHKGHFVDTMGTPTSDSALQKQIDSATEDPGDGYLNDEALTDPHSNRNPLTTRDLVCWSFQIARGMEYLSSRSYIHRDLAARNVLLAADNIVKICDFGLAKDVYKYQEYQKKTDGPLPIKWMALESLTHKVFTTKTDVWSFGVFMWELFSLAASPYPGIELNETFIERLKNGYRMAKPQYASQEIYQIMIDSWLADPESRPSFPELADKIGDFLQDSIVERYIRLGDLYAQRRKSSAAEGNGYLRMNSRGYLAMSTSSADQSAGNARQSVAETGSVRSKSIADSNQSRRYKNEEGEEHEMKPMLHVDMEDEIGDNVHKNSDAKNPIDLKELRVDFTEDSAVTTTALVHGPPKQSPRNCSPHNKNVHKPRRTSDNDEVFLPSPHSSRSKNGAIPLRVRADHSRGGIRKASNGSETSSGFHSDYLNEDLAPPTYSLAVQEDELLETDC